MITATCFIAIVIKVIELLVVNNACLIERNKRDVIRSEQTITTVN